MISLRSVSTREPHHKDRKKTNHYSILRISPNASAAQIKTAYYKLSLIHHPDKNKGTTESQDKFSAISEAYQVLSDKEKRFRYDRTLARPTSTPNLHFTDEILKKHRKKNLKYKYDYDEWTRAHYGTAFQKNQKLSQQRVEFIRNMKQANDKKLMLQRMVQITIILVTVYGTYVLSA